MAIDRIFVEDVGQHDGETVTLKGWLYNKRSSGKIWFLILRDGTVIIQGVVSR
jgi:asparaginyl-tRNA synthetase